MSQVSALQSLDLILEDVSAEINLTINGLEQYSRDNQNVKPLKKSASHLSKLKGVFTLLEMQGAQRLVTDATSLIKSLPKKTPTTRQQLLFIVSTALARLMRYTEHVNQKPYDLPQLLLPAINSMRKSINAPELTESAFFTCDCNKPRGEKDLVLITSEESAEKSRHFRQMYHIGLIEVLRQTNVAGGLRMMQRAIKSLDGECPRPHSPNLWWIGIAMLDGFIHESLLLTRARLKIFSRLDRQIRQVENKPENFHQENRAETRLLAKEMLYLTMISGTDTQRVKNVLAHFNLERHHISDKMLRDETVEMRGPSEQDYHSIAETLLDEINNITDSLSNSRDNDFEPIDLKHTVKQMSNLNNLLKILQVHDQTIRLSVAIDLINNAINEEQNLTEKDINILFIVMESISQAVNDSELAKYSSTSSLRRTKLTKNQMTICEKTHKQVQQLMQSFLTFTKENRKTLLLKDVQASLKDVAKGFQKLKSDQAISIVDGCNVFVDYHLYKNPHSTSNYAINLFADIITSLEFYLETLKFTAQPSEKILEFAEDSLLKLNRETKKQNSNSVA